MFSSHKVHCGATSNFCERQRLAAQVEEQRRQKQSVSRNVTAARLADFTTKARMWGGEATPHVEHLDFLCSFNVTLHN